MTVVKNQLHDPAGASRETHVVARVIATTGFLDGGESEVIARVETVTTDGLWSLDLTPSSEYEDSGAYYEIREGNTTWTAVVPDSGTHWLRDIITDPPDLSDTVLGLTKAQADTYYEPLGGVGGSGAAGGDLTGTYPNPTIAASAVTDAKVAAANKDGTAGTYSMRRLGTSAGMALPGDHASVTNTRTPTAHASSHAAAGSDPVTPGAIGAEVAGAAATAQAAAIAASAQRASNLSDLASASTARTNLGLGNSATRAVGTTAGTVAAGDDGRFGSGGPPTGSAGGSLAGTYPDPTLAANSVGASQITDGTITDAEVAAANKDGAAGTASMRTLGTGAAQALPGNHASTTNSRAPSGTAGGSLAGTYPDPTIAAGAIGGTEIAAAIKDPAAGTAGLRTLSTTGTSAAAGNDSRLSDTRTPTDGTVTAAKIATGVITDTHVAAANKDGTAGTASLRTLGTGAAQAAAGNDTRLSDSRAPNGTASGSLAGTYPGPSIAAGAIGTTELAALAVTDAKVAAANKDGTSGTASMRTLGTSSTQAAAGNHTHTAAVTGAGVYFIANGEWHMPGSSSTTTAFANGELRMIPYVVDKACTLTEMCVEVTTLGSAGSVYRIGVYREHSNGQGKPDALVVDAGTVVTTATGVKTITGLSTALTAGLYWLGAVSQGAPATPPTMRSIASAPWHLAFGASTPTILNGTLGGAATIQTAVTGALPATLTAVVASPATTTNAPRVAFKVTVP